jgi:hypothetical protein
MGGIGRRQLQRGVEAGDGETTTRRSSVVRVMKGSSGGRRFGVKLVTEWW